MRELAHRLPGPHVLVTVVKPQMPVDLRTAVEVAAFFQGLSQAERLPEVRHRGRPVPAQHLVHKSHAEQPPRGTRRIARLLPDVQGTPHQVFFGGHLVVGGTLTTDQCGDVAVMVRHAKTAEGESMSCQVTIALRQCPGLLKQRFCRREFAGKERAFDQCLVGRLVWLSGRAARSGRHGDQDIPRRREPRGRDGRRTRTEIFFVVDLTARQRAERERAELVARERTARAEASSARERLTFLWRAGAVVAATHDQDELLEQVTRLVVPSLADYCVVFLPTGDGELRASALTHTDPDRAGKLAALREHPIPASGPLITQRAYATSTTLLGSDIAAELPAWAAALPVMAEVLASVQPRSALAAPLLAGQRTLGVMLFGRGRERPPFASTDTEVVEEIARRLAQGLANASTFAREHVIAETLQRSILPDKLPQIPGLDLAVRYLPATEGADVGGDWYDAFGVRGGRAALVTGDVAGHNLGSASMMGQVRSMLRAYAIDNPAPDGVLRQTNAALAWLLPDTLASAVFAVLDLATGELVYANAGHPPPILVTGDGQAEYLDDADGIMLGASADAEFTAGVRRLSPGAALLCYTDGLVESRYRDMSKSLTLLAETLRRSAPRSAEHLCATAQAALLGAAGRADDVCLLAARLTG